MDLCKNIRLFALFLCAPFALFGAGSAHSDCKFCQLYSGGLWTGAYYSQNALSSPSLMAGWSTKHFLVDLGYSYGSFFMGGTHSVTSHLGLRNRLDSSNLFLTFGAVGDYVFTRDKVFAKDNPYSVGAFMGLDYQFSRHFMISGKLNPYTYVNISGVSGHQAFSNGSITFAYVY